MQQRVSQQNSVLSNASQKKKEMNKAEQASKANKPSESNASLIIVI